MTRIRDNVGAIWIWMAMASVTTQCQTQEAILPKARIIFLKAGTIFPRVERAVSPEDRSNAVGVGDSLKER